MVYSGVQVLVFYDIKSLLKQLGETPKTAPKVVVVSVNEQPKEFEQLNSIFFVLNLDHGNVANRSLPISEQINTALENKVLLTTKKYLDRELPLNQRKFKNKAQNYNPVLVNASHIYVLDTRPESEFLTQRMIYEAALEAGRYFATRVAPEGEQWEESKFFPRKLPKITLTKVVREEEPQKEVVLRDKMRELLSEDEENDPLLSDEDRLYKEWMRGAHNNFLKLEGYMYNHRETKAE